MPWYPTSRPMLSVLRSLGITRPEGSDPTISDDLSQAVTHPAPGKLGGWGMFGCARVQVALLAGNNPRIALRSSAPGGMIVHGVVGTAGNTPTDFALGFANGAFTATGTQSHIGGRQFETPPDDGGFPEPLGQFFWRAQYAALPTQDRHTGDIFTVNGIIHPVNAYVPPSRHMTWNGGTAAVAVDLMVFYELLPYERSVDTQI